MNCSHCGKPDASKTCSRCLGVKYCSRECQKADWKKHKKACKSMKAKPREVPEMSREALNPVAMQAAVMGRCRNVLIQTPKNVLTACWCCGMLLKKCQPDGTNPSKDPDGPFWIDLAANNLGGMAPPAKHVLGEAGRNSYTTMMNRLGHAAVCNFCAVGLLTNASAHVKKCTDWLRDEALQTAAGRMGLPDLGWVEMRMVSQIALEMEPDLSKGPESIAGYLTGTNGNNIPVPFCYKDIEGRTFPTMLVNAKGFSGTKTRQDELRHYTLMRLYSADSKWRDQPDYVVFSIHRLMAYGATSSDILRQLPPLATVSQMQAGDFEGVNISLKPGFQ